MRRVRLIPALTLVVGAALFLSACGGDDSPEQPIVIPTETTTGGSLDREEFVEEADAICEEANAAIGEYVAAGEGFSAAGEIAELRAGVVAGITDLGAPDEDRATLDSFLAGMEAQVDAGEKIALANERGTDTAQFETELDNAQAETLTAAETYGFNVCGQEASATAATGEGTVTPSTDPGATAAPAPAPSTDAGGVGDTGGGTGDTGGDTEGDTGGGISPGGGVSP